MRCSEKCPGCLSSFLYTSFPPFLPNAIFKCLALLLSTWEVLCSYLGRSYLLLPGEMTKYCPSIKHGHFLNSNFQNRLRISHSTLQPLQHGNVAKCFTKLCSSASYLTLSVFLFVCLFSNLFIYFIILCIFLFILFSLYVYAFCTCVLFVCCMFTFGSFLLNSIPFIILLLSLHIYF